MEEETSLVLEMILTSLLEIDWQHHKSTHCNVNMYTLFVYVVCCVSVPSLFPLEVVHLCTMSVIIISDTFLLCG